MADHLAVTGHATELPELPAQQELTLAQVSDLTQKASWHIASLTRVIDQLKEVLHGTRPRDGAVADASSQLTQREQQVLGLLVRGLSNRKIARTLRISESTVKNHLHAIFLKLDVTDRTQAIAMTLGGNNPR
ncbi:MAG TPA: LuxR C-terminal-related transcriptional regulator [Streptosporangiaceae bacterium]